MNDAAFTRCPGCGTVFRVSPAQLSLREGQVRCGHCRAVFDANDHRVALDRPPTDDLDQGDELLAGRPTVTLRDASALQPVIPRDAPAEVSAAAAAQIGAQQKTGTPVEVDATQTDEAPARVDAAEKAGTPVQVDATQTAKAPAQVAAAEKAGTPVQVDATQTAKARVPVDAAEKADAPSATGASDEPTKGDDAGLRPERFEWKPRKPLRERPRTLYALGLAALVIAIGVQVVLEYRDALAAHAPLTRSALEGACALFGCTVGPLRDAAAISIDASDLQADPAHRGVLKLSATIRNRAAYAIAWPYLELTLTDASDRVVARRAFAPGEYAAAGADPARGIPANGENVVTLFVDASETSQAGYRLYLFYP